MVKIKTREVDKETIRTKGRTLMPSQRIRKANTKAKREGNKENEKTEQSVSEYSADKYEEFIRSSVAKAKNVIEEGTSKTISGIKERSGEQRFNGSRTIKSNRAQNVMKEKATSNITNYKRSIEVKGLAKTRVLKEKIEDGAKALYLSTKALLVSLTGGGTIAVVVIIICCFLGSIVYFSNGEDFKDYKPVIVAVAEDEVGNEGGEKFWKWYGFEERVEWCAIFVSWCAEQCGYLDADIMPKFSAVDDGAEWFERKKQWASNDYVPKTGDIIFFDWESDGLLDHVGIVSKYKDDIVYTVEGNSEDVCRQKQYARNSNMIAGYGVTFCYNLAGKGVE